MRDPKNPQDPRQAHPANQATQQPALPVPVPVPVDPRMQAAEIELARQKVKRERAATLQSLAMAVFTGLSAVAVGWTLVQGRKAHTPLQGTLVKPE